MLDYWFFFFNVFGVISVSDFFIYIYIQNQGGKHLDDILLTVVSQNNPAK